MSSYQEKQKKRIGNYILQDVLGQGAYGIVFKAVEYQNSQKNENFVAIKQIARKMYDKGMLKAFEQEKHNLISLNMHLNIIKTFEIIESKNNYYIVMEFCKGGNLKEYCEQYNNKLDEKRVQVFAAQILNGLKFLRDNEIMHRDIKPENILLDYQNNDIILKISDFGLSKCLKDLNTTQTISGTPLYSSPEILNYQKYDYKSDL